ncbi:MAG: hypothetical protein N2554_03315 [Fimbriimonadales bacterium]|nr:hypothetical protein [Fimbriimonadales bacterium]
MRISGWGFLGLIATLLLAGCQRTPYTQADVHEAIAERQSQTQLEIERGVRAAPPVEVETPPTGGTPSTGNQTAPNPGGVELPPPNRYDTPAPRTSGNDMPVQSPPAVGDVKLDPRTGQYGIQPPGAPETYTIPLDRPQGQ